MQVNRSPVCLGAINKFRVVLWPDYIVLRYGEQPRQESVEFGSAAFGSVNGNFMVGYVYPGTVHLLPIPRTLHACMHTNPRPSDAREAQYPTPRPKSQTSSAFPLRYGIGLVGLAFSFHFPLSLCPYHFL